MNTFKRLFCLLLCIVSVLSLASCADTAKSAAHNTAAAATEPETLFKANGSECFISPSGEEYTFLANEGILYYFGQTYFLAGVEGEAKTTSHLGLSSRNGFYALENDNENSILIRRRPNNEWFAIYRKASLPPLDYSVDNCIRLELLTDRQMRRDPVHTACGDGITDPEEIQQFLSEIRAQQSPRDAGYYDRITKPDGMLDKCYVYGTVYGFFADEPNVAVAMEILSFNDLGYAITIDSKQYVLPDTWLQRLLDN